MYICSDAISCPNLCVINNSKLAYLTYVRKLMDITKYIYEKFPQVEKSENAVR